MIKTDVPKNVPTPRLRSIKELTEEYGATRWYWRKAIWSGELPVVVVNRKQLIDVQDVEAFIEKHKKAN